MTEAIKLYSEKLKVYYVQEVKRKQHLADGNKFVTHQSDF